MNPKPVTLTRQAHKAMDDYLHQVQTAMERSSTSAQEIRSVLTDLEGQILDMLAARGVHEAQDADVRSVLAALDSPEDYASGATAGPAQPSASRVPDPSFATSPTSHRPTYPQPRLSKLAIVSAILTGLCALGYINAFSILLAIRHPKPIHLSTTQPGVHEEVMVTTFAAPAMGALFILSAPGVITGLIAISRIRHSQGQLYGLGWAYFGAAATPLLLVIFMPAIIMGRPAGLLYMVAALAASLWFITKMFRSAMAG